MAIIDYKDKYEKAVQAAMLAKQDTESAVTIGILEEIFPELRESEDERIRKLLVEAVTQVLQDQYCSNRGVSKEKVIAWLEKQGEKSAANKVESKDYNSIDPHFGKPIDKVEPKFNVGDEIKTSNEELLTITKIDEKGYWSDDLFICGFDDAAKWELVGQKPAWSEEDELMLGKCIDAASGYYSPEDKQSMKDWLESLKERVQPQPKQEWKQENTDDLTKFENSMMHIGNSFFGDNAGLDPNDTNIIKEQANLLLELVPKQEWSKEDEYYYGIIQHILNNEWVKEVDEENAINWFKSLKDKVGCEVNCTTTKEWKPSDEQMDALHDAAVYVDKSMFPYPKGILMKLYKQLKKLREE